MSRGINISSVLLVAGGLLLASASCTLAAAQSGTGNHGMPGTPAANVTSSQVLAERDLAGNLLSNVRAETKFSKLAVKKSSNEEVKKMAKQTISENNKLDAKLVTAIAADSQVNTDVYNYGHLTRQADMADKHMSKLSGTDFDRAYLTEMKTYGESSRKMIHDNSGELDSRTQRLTKHIEAISETRMQQVQQLAQSENLNL